MVAGLVVCLGLSWSLPAQAADPDPTDALDQLIATTSDVLDLLTYDVHTTYRDPGQRVPIDRTTGAVVAVPELVNVDGRGLPDLVVAILPQAGRLQLSVTKLPWAPDPLPVLVEAVLDIPGGDGPPLGVAYGYDQLDSTAPGSFTTGLAFSIFRLPSREDLTLFTNVHRAPDELTVIGSLFTRGEDGTRVDPKAARLELSPVPTQVRLDAGLSSREAVPAEGITALDEARVRVRTDQPVHAVVTASTTKGDEHRDIIADIQDLPSDVSVVFDDETLESSDARNRERQQVDYVADAGIGLVDVTVDETVGDARQRSIRATVEDVPTNLSVSLLSDDRAGEADPTRSDAQVEGQVITYQADAAVGGLDLTADTFEDDKLSQQVRGVVGQLPQAFTLTRDVRGIDDPATEETETTQHVEFHAPSGAVGSLAAGFAKGGPVEFIDPEPFFEDGELTEDDVEPGYAFTDGDNAALELFGVSRAVVDTADPVHIDLTSRPGPFLARVLKGSLEVTGRVLDFPAQASVDFSPGQEATADTPRSDPFVRYHGLTPVGRIRAVATNTAAGETLFDRVKTVSVSVDDVPTDLDLTMASGDPDAPPPPDGAVETLASFDAHGAIVGRLEALLTSGTNADGGFPGDGDGVVIRDLGNVFFVGGRITGLSKATLTRSSVSGDPEDFRVESSTTTASIDAPHAGVVPLLVDLDEQQSTGRLHTIVELADRPDTIEELALYQDQAAFPETAIANPKVPRTTALRYRANEDSGELNVCLRRGALPAGFDCSEQDFDLAFLAHGLGARVDRVPPRLDICLASDKLELGRGGVFPRVNCLQGDDAPPYHEPTLCGPDLDLELECVDGQLPISMSLLLRASAPIKVDLRNCRDDEALAAGQACILENGAEFMRIDDLRVQALRAQVDQPEVDTQNNDNGYAYFDTQLDGERTSITGRLLIDPGKGMRMQAEFKDKPDPSQEFHAERRFVAFQPFLLGVDIFHPVFGTCNRGDASIKLGPLQLANDFCF